MVNCYVWYTVSERRGTFPFASLFPPFEGGLGECSYQRHDGRTLCSPAGTTFALIRVHLRHLRSDKHLNTHSLQFILKKATSRKARWLFTIHGLLLCEYTINP